MTTPPTSERNERLDNCPFCGSEAELREQWGTDRKPFEVVCMARIGCHATSGDWGRTPDAISAWNRRAPAEQRVERASGRQRAHRLLDELIDREIARHRKAEPPTTVADLREELHLFANSWPVLNSIGAEILTHGSPIAAEEEKAE